MAEEKPTIWKRVQNGAVWFNLAIQPFGGWPAIGALLGPVLTFTFAKIQALEAYIVPASIMAAGVGALAADMITESIRKVIIRHSRSRRIARAIFDAYRKERSLLAKLRRGNIPENEVWDVVSAWDTEVNAAAREASAQETAGIWTITIPSREYTNRSGLENFVRDKNEGKLRLVMLRAMEGTKMRGDEVLDSSPTGLEDGGDWGPRRVTQWALDALSIFLTEGNTQILNRAVADGPGYQKWHEDWLAWQEKVEEHLEQHISTSERHIFKNLVLVRVPPMDGWGVDHGRFRGQVAQQLEKIREIIIRYTPEARYFG